MFDRMIKAAQLDLPFYEQVEADESATSQALLVVVLVAVATGIGSLSGGLGGLVLGIIAAVVGWAIWAWITYWVGTTLLRTPETQANWGQLARTTGFAQSPGVLRIFAFIPFLGGLILLVTAIWQLVAMVIAVRQALDYQSTWRAVGVVLVGFIPYLILLGLLGRIFGL